MSKLATKSEAIALLANLLRDETKSDEAFLKLMLAMCRLQGWVR